MSPGKAFMCLSCQPGTEPSPDRSKCIPCKEGFFNPKQRGTCMKCPAFTSSRRHDEDIAMYFNKTLANGSLKKDDVEAATHCVLEREFHVLHTGQIFKAEHFSARNICSAENFMKNSNFCAGSKLIGPISDIQTGGGRDRDRDR